MPLLNAFIDSFVCVGFSSESGLTLDSESNHNEPIFKSYLQPSLLALVTADRAMYPQSRGSEFIDPSYPPIGRSNSYSSSGLKNDPVPSTPLSPSGSGTRTSKQHMIPDTLKSLPPFCFPDGVKATYQRENERIHHIVLTQEQGKRSYALVLTFQQPFILKTNKPDKDGTYQIDDVQLSTSATKTRSKKIPSAFPNYADPSTASKASPSTSNDTTEQQRHDEVHTSSSYMKESVL
jgi:hypothetical protein